MQHNTRELNNQFEKRYLERSTLNDPKKAKHTGKFENTFYLNQGSRNTGAVQHRTTNHAYSPPKYLLQQMQTRPSTPSPYKPPTKSTTSPVPRVSKPQSQNPVQMYKIKTEPISSSPQPPYQHSYQEPKQTLQISMSIQPQDLVMKPDPNVIFYSPISSSPTITSPTQHSPVPTTPVFHPPVQQIAPSQSDDLSIKLDQAIQQKEMAEDELFLLQENMAMLQNQIAHLTNESNNLKIERDAIQSQLNKSKSDLDQFTQAHHREKSDAAKLNRDRQTSDEECERWRKKFLEMESKCQEMERKCVSFQSQNQDLQDQNATLQLEMDVMVDKHKQALIERDGAKGMEGSEDADSDGTDRADRIRNLENEMVRIYTKLKTLRGETS
eukprot:TRINITY_DN9998_c0_g1_i1.p1 TRINITY_DN9998_c0_g1~~TRINITY_DN9998_c0_g1_i1.p1  ORF type:complete len:382 (-),score=96.84 TRINITY_DN9998_c0_g1_i1:6-1151(-)